MELELADARRLAPIRPPARAAHGRRPAAARRRRPSARGRRRGGSPGAGRARPTAARRCRRPSSATKTAASRVPAHGPQVAPLVADRAPAVVGDQPALRLRADRLGERDERRRRRRAAPACANRGHSTTTPCAAAARVAGRGERCRPAPTSTAADAAEEEVPPPPADDVVARAPRAVELGRVGAALAVDVRLVEVDARRGRSPPRRQARARATLTTTCMIAPRSRTEPALPTTSRGRPPRERRSTAPSCSSAGAPGASRAAAGFRSYSPSMLFRWMPVPGHDHARAGAGRGRQRGGVAARVDDGDVRRATGARRLGRTAPARRGCAAAPRACSARRAGARRARRGGARARSRRSRARLCSRITSTSARSPRRCRRRRSAEPVEQPQPVGDQHAAGRRRRVRDEHVRRGTRTAPAGAG